MTVTSAHPRLHRFAHAAATLVTVLAIGCGTGARPETRPTSGAQPAPRPYDASTDLGPLFRVGESIIKGEAAALHRQWLASRPQDYSNSVRFRIEGGS